MINKPLHSELCWVWDNSCPNIIKCAQKNKIKLQTILGLKNEYWDKKLAIIAIELIHEIESVFDVEWKNQSYSKYLMHYLNNWLWWLLDTLYFECNHNFNSDNRMLRIYILNIQRLKVILDKTKSFSEDQKMMFLNIIKKSLENSQYLASLSNLLKIINYIETNWIFQIPEATKD
ncbi:MAG: hypothetical protein ACD_3C00082G0006 [uncultured bacterium (gcode 4)]|uniref:Uncharacterized protein n=1 Tax=uncultured bacterium (gcode 4) TaxID=1234023 RepID=K2GDG5_9BACT|nr:MAG: hypothetical protein ACD_3C00082G0006 [uncultured bacterium (gcode 4)]